MPIQKNDFHQPLGCKTCKHIACVCNIQKNHGEACRFRIAATCPAGIACDHGRDVCPICDPCTCKEEQK